MKNNENIIEFDKLRKNNNYAILLGNGLNRFAFENQENFSWESLLYEFLWGILFRTKEIKKIFKRLLHVILDLLGGCK
jgi:hypothetical protein